MRSHLQCETADVISAAIQVANKREKEASSAVSSQGKKKAMPSKSPAMMHLEQLSSQFMSFLSSEQEKGKLTHSSTSLQYSLLENKVCVNNDVCCTMYVCASGYVHTYVRIHSGMYVCAHMTV